MGGFKNNRIEVGKMSGVKVGISLPASGVENNEFRIGVAEGVERVFEVREPQSLISQLGLPPGTQRQDLVELLNLLKRAESPDHLAHNIRPSDVWQRLRRMADAGIDLTKFAGALWGLKQQLLG